MPAGSRGLMRHRLIWTYVIVSCSFIRMHILSDCLCSHDLLLWNKLPQNILTQSKNHFIVSHNFVGHEFKQGSEEDYSAPWGIHLVEGLVWRFWDGLIYMLDILVGMAGRLNLAGLLLLSMTFQRLPGLLTLSLQQSSLSSYMVSVKEFVDTE